jgi:uncharacterized protein
MRNQKTKAGSTVAVIADTHNLLRPEAVEAMNGVDLIVHARDVCRPKILAPLAVVRGNNDRGTWSEEIPIRRTVEIKGVLIFSQRALSRKRLIQKARLPPRIC